MYTIKNFLDLLTLASSRHSFLADLSLICDDSDCVNASAVLTKMTAARLCHGVLLHWMKEPDNNDWAAARLLKDIYDCHTCVIHIAQVYVKGIIAADSAEPLVFGNKTELSEEEAEVVVYRLFETERRLEVPVMPVPKIKYILPEDIGNLSKVQMVTDVRPLEMCEGGKTSAEDFKKMFSTGVGQFDNLTFKNHPLKNIVQNPYLFGPDLSENIVLFCSKGYQSALAADVLVKAGYLNVYVVR